MEDLVDIVPMGEKAILLNFQPRINEELLEKILSLKSFLLDKLLKEEVEIINTYSSLLIKYPSPIKDIYGQISSLKKLVKVANIPLKTGKKIFHVPVCYDEQFALDMELLSNYNGLSREEIISLHTAPLYTVYFTGFLPGFLYLGGLNKTLQISRKEQPRLKVKKGAVGIGENQTGIYPKASPGGWQIIGNSPVQFFNKNAVPPCPISAGDKIKFHPISNKEYEEIFRSVEENTFTIKWEDYDS